MLLSKKFILRFSNPEKNLTKVQFILLIQHLTKKFPEFEMSLTISFSFEFNKDQISKTF